MIDPVDQDKESYQQVQRKIQVEKNKQFALAMLSKLRARQVTKTEVL